MLLILPVYNFLALCLSVEFYTLSVFSSVFFFCVSLLSAFLTRFCSFSVCDAFALCMFIVSLPFFWLLCPCPLSLLCDFSPVSAMCVSPVSRMWLFPFLSWCLCPLSILCVFSAVSPTSLSPVSPSVFAPCLSYVYLPPLFLFAFCLSVVCLSSICPTMGFLCALCTRSHVSISVAHLFSCLFLPSLFPSSYLIHCPIKVRFFFYRSNILHCSISQRWPISDTKGNGMFHD